MKKVIEMLPIIMFIIVLLFTNTIGVCLLVWGPISYWKVSYLFCGMSLPDIHVSDMYRLLIMLVIPVLLLAASGFVGKAIAKRILQKKEAPKEYNSSNMLSFLSVGVSAILFIYIFARLFSFLNIGDISAWLNNNDFYDTRYIVMNNLSFYEFALIYSILPMMIGMSYQQNKKGLFILGLEFVLYIIVNIYIFQKRPLIVGIMLIGIMIMLNNIEIVIKWKLRKILGTGLSVCIVLYLVYALGITVNTIREDSKDEYILTTEKIVLNDIRNIASETEVSESHQTLDTTEQEPVYRTFELESATLQLSSFEFTQLMAVVGLLNRTAFGTIVDLTVFPRFFDYYPIDIGLDLLGIGLTPDENIVAAKILYPDAERPGSVPVPYHIALYTQGGIIVAIIGSIIVGFCIGFFWIIAISKKHILNYAFGAWICVFAIMLATNSGRNALFSSDGAVWPVIVLGCIALGRLFYIKIKERLA